jgi:hypothetical protein
VTAAAAAARCRHGRVAAVRALLARPLSARKDIRTLDGLTALDVAAAAVGRRRPPLAQTLRAANKRGHGGKRDESAPRAGPGGDGGAATGRVGTRCRRVTGRRRGACRAQPAAAASALRRPMPCSGRYRGMALTLCPAHKGAQGRTRARVGGAFDQTRWRAQARTRAVIRQVFGLRLMRRVGACGARAASTARGLAAA